MEYSEDTVMETRGLTFSYDGEQNILENLDFAILAGKVTVLMGANGCGKSTLFKLMTKNLYPDEGSIILEGEDIDEMRLTLPKRWLSSIRITRLRRILR